MRLNTDIKKLTKQKKKLFDKLMEQQESVVKPLIEQCSKREEHCQWMRDQLQEKQKSLKILYAMVRSPKMCDMLQKAERKYLTKERLKQVTENAIHTLRQYRFDQNVTQFVDQVYGTIQSHVAEGKDPFLNLLSPQSANGINVSKLDSKPKSPLSLIDQISTIEEARSPKSPSA